MVLKRLHEPALRSAHQRRRERGRMRLAGSRERTAENRSGRGLVHRAMHRKRTLLFGTTVAVAAGLAAGCGGGTSGSQSQAASTSGNAQSPSPAQTITVKETEFKLTPSTV